MWIKYNNKRFEIYAYSRYSVHGRDGARYGIDFTVDGGDLILLSVETISTDLSKDSVNGILNELDKQIELGSKFFILDEIILTEKLGIKK